MPPAVLILLFLLPVSHCFYAFNFIYDYKNLATRVQVYGPIVADLCSCFGACYKYDPRGHEDGCSMIIFFKNSTGLFCMLASSYQSCISGRGPCVNFPEEQFLQNATLVVSGYEDQTCDYVAKKGRKELC